ncbi:TIGR02285 family protein [Pseudomonas gingeri]|uniref:TIGR02285 family protein n=1 Tax=Pseudomonas gingeri TaxID=117681 RepID=A0A7Y7Y9M4_9PSED|nr:TIGR02285 family protein [Pseudomonas gingeri]NWB28761.1 TIGR02285 family protein [Pseudomonas gingeri]NWC32187.1 TIGR02285 family protein [Pseudomonas gingeri]NWD05905.1 TIGR02285 family protein [Pseudomonas gingeri]NWD47177.1 TIGR02285 family protein [Pseudomonas gingeri]NWE35741.1 TIGR02285 family protein [Pseudomonas gingeri]
MTPSALWRHLGLPLLAVLICALPQTGQARETLTWLLRDLPPLSIFDGPKEGQGAVDRMLPLLMAALPEYEHTVLRVNRARGMQMLGGPLFTCDPALLWTAARAQKMLFSIPSMGTTSNGLVIRPVDQALIAPFVFDGRVDLAALLGSNSLQLGIVAERSYGHPIDDVLHHTRAQNLVPHYGNDALGSLLQMQRLGRLKALLGYWAEIHYQAQQQQIADDDLVFYPIKGTANYQFIRVACSNTPQGRAAIPHINEILRGLRRQTLVELYAHWLAPPERDKYREDAREFFLAPEEQ